MGEAMLSTSSCLSVYIWKCCVRGGVGSMGREASLTNSNNCVGPEEASLTLLLVSVSMFGDFTSVLGQGKQVRLYFFTSQCLYLEILRQCWGRESKLDYSSSRLSVYMWRFYLNVGVGEAS